MREVRDRSVYMSMGSDIFKSTLKQAVSPMSRVNLSLSLLRPWPVTGLMLNGRIFHLYSNIPASAVSSSGGLPVPSKLCTHIPK